MSSPSTISLHDTLYTYKEAAEILRRHEITVRRDVAAGRIEHLRIGGRVYFTEAQLNAFLNSCRVPAREGDR